MRIYLENLYTNFTCEFLINFELRQREATDSKPSTYPAQSTK